MNGSILRTLLRPAAGLFLALLIVTVALAGGFHLSVELPAATSAPALRDAVLVVRTFGCSKPTEARLSATAEGILDGKRQSRPLQLQAVSDGVYALPQQWPSEGSWVLAITGTYHGATSSALVELGPGGAVVTAGDTGRLPVRILSGKLSRRAIDDALAEVTRREAARTESTGRTR